MRAECSNCGAPVHARGRCHLCYVYWRRNGRERPEAVAVAHALRELQARQAARIHPSFRRLIGA